MNYFQIILNCSGYFNRLPLLIANAAVEKKDVIVDIVIDEDKFEVKSGEEVEKLPLTYLSDKFHQDDPVFIDNVDTTGQK